MSTSAMGGTQVAVMAEQWSDARLAIADVSLEAHFREVEPVICFAYLAQRPPESALASPGRTTFARPVAATASSR